MLGRLAAWVERLGGGLIGCRWWAALLCCDFLCAPSLFSPLSLSRSSAPWVQAVGLALVFGWALALHGRRRSRFPGLGAGLAGVQAVPVVVAGLGAGLAVGVVAGVSRSSNCTVQALQVWLLFKGKAINFERFFLDFVHKVRYNSTRVKEIANQLRFAAPPLVDGGRNPQKGLVKQS